MATTLTTMRGYIADELARSDLNTQIDRAINRAIRHYQKERMWFNETTGTFNTTASKQAYGVTDSLPSNIREIDKVQLTTSASYKYTLVPRTYQYILDVNTSGSSYTGYPSDWAWYQEKIYLYPTPDQAYTITISYQKGYADLGATESNDWTDNCEDLIEARARWWIASRYLQDSNIAGLAKQDEMDALSSLRSRMHDLAYGKLRPTGF